VPLYPFRAWLPAPFYWSYRAARTAGVAFCFAFFWGGAVLIAWLVLPLLWLWPGSRADKMHRVHRTVRRGFGVFHFVMYALRLYHRRSPVKALRPTASPVVLVANHPTLCDVTSIASLFPDVVAVASPRFAANPLLGHLVRGCGFVPTDCHMIRDCEERLRMGFDVLVFPEGTRSPVGGSLHPFHRGAFELAARAKVPIVLLKLTCVPSALSKNLPIWKVADHMAVLTIEPIETIHPGERGVESRALCRAIEQRYRDLFGYAVPAVPVPAVQAVPG
jgi:1-acyl-sn-glycerol-3-phosphate acyltransferase